MSRAAIVLRREADRARAIAWMVKAPFGTRVEFKAAKRSLPQNSRMWAMISDVATQLRWHGQKLSTEDWKCLFIDGLKREMRLVPNLDGNGFVPLGRSSSDLSKQEMSDLFIIMEKFAAEHGVIFKDQET